MNFFKVIALLAYVFFCFLFSGFVITELWAWFVVPIFSVKPLVIAQALGLSLFTGYVCGNMHRHSHDERTNDIKMGVLIVIPALVWCLGWVIKSFI